MLGCTPSLRLGRDEPSSGGNRLQARTCHAPLTGGYRLANRRALPPNLTRYEAVIDIESRGLSVLWRRLHVIGEDRTEQLDLCPVSCG